MITLNGSSLDENLIWQDKFANPSAKQSNRTTLGQRPVIQHASGYKAGQPITLEATAAGDKFYGYWTQAQILEIQEYERQGSQVSLHYHGHDFTVMVQAGSIDVTPIDEYADAEDSDKLSGSITFIQL